MVSKRIDILKALTEHLEAIVVDPDGEAESLTGKVFRGRTVFGDEVAPPFLVILEAPRQLLSLQGGDEKTTRKDDWRLLIQGFAQDDSINPLDPAYELLAYVEQRMARLLAEKGNGGGPLYPLEFRLGKRVHSILFTNPIVHPPDNDVSDTAYFYMPVTIQVATDMEAPFTEET